MTFAFDSKMDWASESKKVYLGSTVARLKLKGIGRRGDRLWNMRFNA